MSGQETKNRKVNFSRPWANEFAQTTLERCFSQIRKAVVPAWIAGT